MKFGDLDIELFLAITKATINLADRGLVLIQGVNLSDSSAQSNGAGKSTIADALCWVLYGVTAREVSGDDVVNDAAGKGTRVQIKIMDGGTTYRIVRHRKHKTGKNRLEVYQSNGLTEIDLTKGKDALTQDVVNKILGASYDVFKGAIYAGQEQMPDLPNMTDKPLKMLIEEAAGITVLEEAYKIALKDLSAAKIKLDDANADLDSLLRKKSWLDTQLENAKNSAIEWTGTHTFRLSRVTENAVDLVKQAKAIDVSFDLAGAESQVAALNAKIAAVSGESVEFTRLDRLVSTAEAKIRAIESEILGHSGALTRAETELRNVGHKVGCPCDECGRPLTAAELSAATDAAQKKVDAYTSALDDAAKKLSLAKVELETVTTHRDNFMLSMTDLGATSTERASLQRQIDNHKYQVSERDKLIARARDQKALLETMKVETNPHDATVKDFYLQVSDLDAAITAQNEIVAELGKAVDLEAENAKTFGPAGARAAILDDVTPFLNIQTAKYLSTLADGNIEATWTTLTKGSKGDLKEKFSIDVVNTKGGKLFKAISGGEKKKVRVATALALQDLVATRATKPIELFIGDEIDGALDPAGLERLTMVLEEKAAERGTVMVISHLEMRDWISNVLQVEKSATGETTITELAA